MGVTFNMFVVNCLANEVHFPSSVTTSVYYSYANYVINVHNLFGNKNLYSERDKRVNKQVNPENSMPFFERRGVSNQSNSINYRFNGATVIMAVVILHEKERFMGNVLISITVEDRSHADAISFPDDVGFVTFMGHFNDLVAAMADSLAVGDYVHSLGNLKPFNVTD